MELFLLFYYSYGLLGSSGCGKTTLLRCILGRLQLAEGDISVMGKPPGSRGHKIPGRDVGYMPQVTNNNKHTCTCTCTCMYRYGQWKTLTCRLGY